MWRDDATLLDILQAARLALGEAAKHLSAGFRDEHPGVPSKAIAGMRDRLLHGYDDVDLELVWKTVDEDLPALVVRREGLAPRRAP